jgi:PAS domain S-box-containing protein
MASSEVCVPAVSLLYIDDEAPLLELGKRFLEHSGNFTVTTALSAPEAIRLLSERSFDVIISDYQMPEMDGIAFLRYLREGGDRTPFIIFTGRGREEVVIEALNAGADFYVQKGGNPKAQFAELRNMIQKAVDHRRSDKQVIVLSRLYAVLSATNKAIVRIHDKSDLLIEICRVLVEIGGFRMAWAGFINPEKHSIEPLASYGYVDGYLDTIPLSTDDIPEGRGPTGTALRERRYNICNDIACDPRMAPWQAGALERGYHSLAAFPFAQDTKSPGVIAFYASEPGFFTDPIIRLLDELSMDLSFALVSFDHREQRITAEHDLKTSERQYRRLFETSRDAILILDADTGRIIDANPFIQDLLGYPMDYFAGKKFWDLDFIRDKSFARKAFHDLETNGYIRYDCLPLETKQGQVIDVEFISNVNSFGDKRIIQCNIRDITDWKQTKDALYQANKKLNLLSSITRQDINNQIRILTGNLAMLEEGQPEPARNEYFRDAVSAAQRISAIIQFTREYEQIGRNDPVWQDCRNLVETVSEQAPLGQVPVQNDLPAGMEVFADPLITRVFYNLIDNAVRHGGMITTIRFSFLESGDDPLIVCEDDGVGISLQEKEKIFEQGFGKNTGLGLFLSREILGITGITITETGEPGKGARFEIVVPKGKCRFTRV